MGKGYKKLTAMLSIIMLFCLFAPYVVSADTPDSISSEIQGDADQAGIQCVIETNITPTLKSVDTNNDGTFTANWGYQCNIAYMMFTHPDNESTVAAGPGGTITSEGTPPDSFWYTGSNEADAFSTVFNGSVTWTLVYHTPDLVCGKIVWTRHEKSVTATEPNFAPVVTDKSYSTNEVTLLTIDVSGGVLKDASDVNGDTLTASVIMTSVNGVLSLAADGSFTYMPDTGFAGTDTFTFVANDGELDSEAATVTINVVHVGIPNVGIIKTVDRPNAYAGDSVKYTITVTNTGDTTLHDIIVYDDLADKSWMLANQEPSSSSSAIIFDYIIPADKQANDTITNTATVYANESNDVEYQLLSEGTESNILEEYEGNIAIEYGTDSFDLVTSVSAIVTVIERTTNHTSSSDSGRSADVRTYTLRTAVNGEGTVSPGPGASEWSRGSTVQLRAAPAEGWKFDGWQGDAVNESNQIRMNGNKSVTAVFSLIAVEIEEIEDESAPQTPVTEPQEIEIEEEEVPAAPVEELPKTGGVPAGVFYGLGGLITAVGAIVKRRTKM